jgi:hypothetical protein
VKESWLVENHRDEQAVTTSGRHLGHLKILDRVIRVLKIRILKFSP